jgi:hypothetical protein
MYYVRYYIKGAGPYYWSYGFKCTTDKAEARRGTLTEAHEWRTQIMEYWYPTGEVTDAMVCKDNGL